MKHTPHYVLFSRTGEQSAPTGDQGGAWYFRLESTKGQDCLEASDFEAHVGRERLELLAAVRGLEALEQPSTVTLVTGSRQLARAIRQGLDFWRQRDWKWERFGEKVPMRNADLWQRIDRALQIHDVRCRHFRLDAAHPSHASSASPRVHHLKRRRSRWLPRPMLISLARHVATVLHHLADALQGLVPEPASPKPHPSA